MALAETAKARSDAPGAPAPGAFAFRSVILRSAMEPLAPEVARWLPNLFVIGAPKAGTTSLHAYLAEHPQIAMTSIKEPMCFARRDWRERVERYRDLLDGRYALVRGESSTAYSSYPWAPDVPARIADTVADPRFVYLVRDPIARTISHYAQNLWDRKPTRPFEELLDDPDAPLNMPLWCSRYATQLERWHEQFGSERVLVLDQRDLLTDRDGTIARVLEFVGVESGFRSPAWAAEHNTAEQHRVPTRLGARLPVLTRGPLARLGTREIPRPELTPAQRRRLEELLAPEARRLRELTGLELDHWSV